MEDQITISLWGFPTYHQLQVNDDYDTKDDKLTPYKQLVEELKQHFSNISFEKIPRVQNRVIDTMASMGSVLDMLNNGTQFEIVVE